MNYEKINWTTGEKVREGYVIIDGVTYQTVQPEYTGETPINVENLNKMDEAIKKIADYIDARYKTLWTGSWSSGDITVTDVSKYNSIIVYVDNGDNMVCYRNANGTQFQGSNIFGSSTQPDHYTKIFICSISGDTLTLATSSQLGHQNGGNHMGRQDKTVSKIVGLDPIIE